MFPLSPLNWVYVGVVLLMVSMGVGLKIQTNRLHTAQTALITLTTQVKVIGEQAEKTAKLTRDTNKKAKAKTDATIKILRTYNDALSQRLLDARTSSGYLPPQTGDAGSSKDITFERDKLERAVQQLDAGVQGLIEQGDQDRVILEGVKEWDSETVN